MRPHLPVRTTPLAWCSLLACLTGAVLALAGCGASAAPPASHRAPVKPKRSRQTLVSAAVITTAARLSASQPGYAVNLSVSVDSTLLEGVATATGNGKFNAGGGSMTAVITLPGLLALISPLTAPVVVASGTAYIEVPEIAAQEMPGLEPWLSVSLNGAGQLLGLPAGALAGSLTPRTILDALADGSTGRAVLVGSRTVDGQPTTEYTEAVPKFGAGHSVAVWIATGTGMLSRIVFNSASHRDAARIDFTAYGVQSVATPPPASQVGSLSAALNNVGL